jgi:multidrug efflux system membrane fusion protein
MDMTGIRKHKKWAAAALAVIALVVWRGLHKPAAAAEHKLPSAVAVDTAAAVPADVPIYLSGLGTVQAYYTVTVTARVDGELLKVAFTEGQMVRKGDLLAQIDPRPNRAAFDQAVATKVKDQAQLANAKRDLDRYTQLQPQDLASKQTVDTQHALVDQLAAQLKIDQAVIDNARTQLDYTRIVSPISGRTGIRLVDPGNIVHATDTTGIVVVTQVQPISVIFTLPEEELGSVAAALAAGVVQVTTRARGGGAVLDQGTLSLIDNQIDQPTGTVKLKATFDNARNTLWPGQYVDARVQVRTDRDALTIPDAAVQLGPGGPFTYVVKADSTVEVRPLHIVEGTAGVTIVTSGLKAGERVVTSNQYRLEAGVHVRTAADAPVAGSPSSGPRPSGPELDGSQTGNPRTGGPPMGGPRLGGQPTGSPPTGDPPTSGPRLGGPRLGGPRTGDPPTGGSPTSGKAS